MAAPRLGLPDSGSQSALLNSVGRVTIRNSPSVWIELTLPSSSSVSTLTFPRGYVTQWGLPTGFSYTVDIYNSVIDKVDPTVSFGSKTVIQNSTLYGIGWLVGLGGYQDSGSEILDGLREGYFADQTFSYTKYGVNTSLRLVNSSVEKWWPMAFGTMELIIRNARLADPGAMNQSIYRIQDSRIDSFMASHQSRVYISDTTISWFVTAVGYSTVYLDRVNFSGQVSVMGNGRVFRDGVQIAP